MAHATGPLESVCAFITGGCPLPFIHRILRPSLSFSFRQIMQLKDGMTVFR